MELRYTKSAEADLARIDKPIARRIKAKLLWYAFREDPLVFAKKLENWPKAYRLRIGDYRAICTVEQGKIVILLILSIEHRKEVYR